LISCASNRAVRKRNLRLKCTLIFSMMEEGEGRASGGAPKKVVLVATPFTLAISMVNVIFSATRVSEKT